MIKNNLPNFLWKCRTIKWIFVILFAFKLEKKKTTKWRERNEIDLNDDLGYSQNISTFKIVQKSLIARFFFVYFISSVYVLLFIESSHNSYKCKTLKKKLKNGIKDKHTRMFFISSNVCYSVHEIEIELTKKSNIEQVREIKKKIHTLNFDWNGQRRKY